MPNLVDIVEVAEALESKAVYLASDRCVVVRIHITQVCFPGDCQTVKQCLVCSDFKEAFQHTHIQRFPKTPRSGKQVYFSPVVQ